ncbi:MAG: class I SAM-dependent rRNA methyltransferase [Planctomycetota bacterium]
MPGRRVPSVVLRGGPPVHPAVFSKRVLRTEGNPRDGDLVRIRTKEGRACGFGLWHGKSQIALRVLSFDADRVPDGDWLHERLVEAESLRKDVLRLPEVTNAWRLCHGEGDGLAGLVIDRYENVASVSLFSLGWWRRMEELEAVLRESLGITDVIVRTDEKTSRYEGFTVPEPTFRGELDVHENGVHFIVDPAGGHKTGFFLDQRDNRARLAHWCRGKTVFDGMTYTGGFALAAKAGGATMVRAFDLDEEAIAMGERNAERNGLEVLFGSGDVFDALREIASLPVDERPDVVNVDPAKWARDRAGLGAALYRYRDLNRLALLAVKPGGLVGTHSCSGLVSEEMFLGVIREAALDTQREVRVLALSGAAPDHPFTMSHPEGRYLKSAFLQVGPEGSGPGNRSHPDFEKKRGGPPRKPRN